MRRERTNTPLQALLLLNDPQYVEAARGLAQRVLLEGGDSDRARAGHMFRLCLGRHPTRGELTDLVTALEEDHRMYREYPEAARQLVAVGEAPLTEQFEVAQVAAYTLSASVLLNLDEMVTKN